MELEVEDFAAVVDAAQQHTPAPAPAAVRAPAPAPAAVRAPAPAPSAEPPAGLALEIEDERENTSRMAGDGLRVVFHTMEDRTGQSDFFGITFGEQPRPAADSGAGGGGEGGADRQLKVIRRIRAGSAAATIEPQTAGGNTNTLLSPGMVLLKVQGENVESERLEHTLARIESAILPITLTFASGAHGDQPQVVELATPRDTYGFPFAVGRGAASGYFHTTPRTHQRIDTAIKTRSVSRKARKQVESQEKKWRRWCDTSGVAGSSAPKLARRGVPDEMRCEVWPALAAVEGMKASSETTFAQWCTREQTAAESESAGRDAFDLEQIEKDLGRTFPSHRLFDSGSAAQGLGIEVLRQMLTLFVHRNPSMGYVQSMNYVAATIIICLLQRDGDASLAQDAQEDAFWTFSSIVERIMKEYYAADLFGVQRDTLTMMLALKRLMPQLYAHVEALGMTDRLEVQFFTP